MHECDHIKELENAKLRRTKDRHELLHAFSARRAWSVAQLHLKLGGTLSTIYRNVQTLAENGILREIGVLGTERFYERAALPHHDHISCLQCGAVECTPCQAPSLPSHDLFLNTTCSACP